MMVPVHRLSMAGALLLSAGGAAAQPLEGLPPTLQFRTDLVPGHYACRDGDAWTSEFDILDGTVYNLRGNPVRAGEFSYDGANSTIRWISGPFASTAEDSGRITGFNTTRIDDGKPVILLHFEDPSYGASTEYCALVE